MEFHLVLRANSQQAPLDTPATLMGCSKVKLYGCYRSVHAKLPQRPCMRQDQPSGPGCAGNADNDVFFSSVAVLDTRTWAWSTPRLQVCLPPAPAVRGAGSTKKAVSMACLSFGGGCKKKYLVSRHPM